jgi:hypothetical protein
MRLPGAAMKNLIFVLALFSTLCFGAEKEIVLSTPEYTITIKTAQLSCKMQSQRRAIKNLVNGDVMTGCAIVDDDSGILITWDNKGPTLEIPPLTNFYPYPEDIPTTHDPVGDAYSQMPSQLSGTTLRL